MGAATKTAKPSKTNKLFMLRVTSNREVAEISSGLR